MVKECVAFRNFAVRCSIDGNNNGEALDNYKDMSLARLGDTMDTTSELGQSLLVVLDTSSLILHAPLVIT